MIFGVNNILDHANLLGVILITLLLVVWINFVSSDLVQFISSSSIRPWCFFDHYLVDHVIDLSHFLPQGRVLWKFHNFLLTDNGFCDHLSSRISDLASCIPRFSSQDWWKFFKLCRKECIDFAKQKRIELNCEKVNFTNSLILCKQLLIQGDVSAWA